MKFEQHKLVRFDWAMKSILRNKANFDILEGFLSELLKEQITIDHLLESESNQERVDEKFNRVDLLVHTASDEKIIIEVQTASQWDFYHRILFGTSKVITEYVKLGQPYSKVPKVISVSILHFNLGEGGDYMYQGVTEFTGMHTQDILQLSQESIKLYINKLEKDYASVSDIFPTYYLIQLEKFSGDVRDRFDQWVYLLRNESIQDNFDAQGILSAKEKLDILKLTEDERINYDKYWQNVSFEASLAETHQFKLELAQQELELAQQELEIAKQELELSEKESELSEKELELSEKESVENLEKGKAEAKVEMAKMLIMEGADLGLIQRISGLSEDELSKLIKATK